MAVNCSIRDHPLFLPAGGGMCPWWLWPRRGARRQEEEEAPVVLLCRKTGEERGRVRKGPPVRTLMRHAKSSSMCISFGRSVVRCPWLPSHLQHLLRWNLAGNQRFEKLRNFPFRICHAILWEWENLWYFVHVGNWISFPSNFLHKFFTIWGMRILMSYTKLFSVCTSLGRSVVRWPACPHISIISRGGI